TWVGKPWVPIEWLAEVIYASAYRLAGYGGVAALVTAALMALHATVFLNASRWVRSSLLPVVAMDFALVPTMLARPHLLTWPLLAALLALSLMQMRHQAMLAIVAAMVLPQGFAKGVATSFARDMRRGALWAASAGAAALVAMRAAFPIQPSENDTNPWRLIAA